MPDTKPMLSKRFNQIDKFVGRTDEWVDRLTYGRYAAELRDEVRRLRKREGELVESLGWALRFIRGPGHWKDANGPLHCALCGIILGAEHDGICPYREAKEVLKNEQD